jgi:hypothetical protein
MTWLKQTVMQLGGDVPLYTVTGWGGGSVPPYEFIPLWGGYADAPWAEHVGKNFNRVIFSLTRSGIIKI